MIKLPGLSTLHGTEFSKGAIRPILLHFISTAYARIQGGPLTSPPTSPTHNPEILLRDKARLANYTFHGKV